MTITASRSTSTLAGFIGGGRLWIGHAASARKYEGAVPREDALELLSFPIVEGAIHSVVITEDGVDDIIDETRKSIIRLDTRETFGIFKQGYKPHPYPQWLVENVDILLDGGMKIGTVALTNGGARAMLQAELPEDRIATAPGAEPVRNRPHISAMTSLDGSIASTYGIGTRVLACENELSLAGFRGLVKGFTRFQKTRHTSGSLGRVLEVREALGLVAEEIGDAFDQQFRELVSQVVTDRQFDEIVRAYTGIDAAKEGRSKTMAQQKVDALNDLWTNDLRAAPWRGSLYGVLATFNTAQHHVFGADKGRDDRNNDRVIKDEWAKFDTNVLALANSVIG